MHLGHRDVHKHAHQRPGVPVTTLLLLVACIEYGASRTAVGTRDLDSVVDADSTGESDTNPDPCGYDLDGDGILDCEDQACTVVSGTSHEVPADPDCELAFVPDSDPFSFEEMWSDYVDNDCHVTAVADLDGDGGGDVLCAAVYGRSKLVALRGTDGAMLWGNDGFRDYGSIVVGDVDRDGSVDVVGLTPEGYLVALNSDGTIKWIGVDRAGVDESSTMDPLELHDLDGDGAPELITNTGIFKGENGDHVASFTNVRKPLGQEIAAADIDLDGHQDILSDYACWASNGSLQWMADAPPTIHNTSKPIVLNADTDPEAEVAWVDIGHITMVDSDGTPLWSADTEPANTPPAMACASDLDGDGIDELVIETPSALIAMSGAEGSTLWQIPVDEAQTGGMTGCSFFDFDGDGRPELLYSDEHTFYLLDSGTGATLYSVARISATGLDLPIVADLDGDGSAEIVINVAGNWDHSETVIAYHHPGGNWPPAPPIWGSATWSGTTLWADGEVRSEPSRPWQNPGFWRGQVSGPLGGRDLAVSIEDSCISSCDDAVGTVSLAVQVANHGPQSLRAGSILTVATSTGSDLQTIALDSIAVGWTLPVQVDVPVVDARNGLILSVASDCSTSDDSVTWGADACL